MVWGSPKDAMPWVGLYVVVASLICTLAMAADAVQAIWQWKLWFPNNFFTLNASTITLIAIEMKLPVDLTSGDPNDLGCNSIRFTKITGTYFLTTMLANFLPSLGLMDDRELLMNIVALGILIITIAVNIGIQSFTRVLYQFVDTLPILIFAFVLPFSVALTVSASRKKLEHRYKESQRLVSGCQEKMFSLKGLRSYVKKYWMMTETRNPQFVIACSPVTSAFGVTCLYVSMLTGAQFVQVVIRRGSNDDYDCDTADYKWSVEIIFILHSGTLVGSIAPIFRCLSSVGHYNLSKEWSKNHLNVFRVEKHWIQMLQQWKRRHVYSHIPGHHCKIVFHNVKNMVLNFCLSLSYCWHFIKSCTERLQKAASTTTSTPNGNGRSEIKEYIMYVVQIEEDEKLSDRILRNTLRYITQLLNASEEKEPQNLMMLLEKSKGFNGVVEFENDQVQPLYQDGTHNCWSLVVVTLTSIAIALPNIAHVHVKSLLSGVREGIQIVRNIEECLNGDDETLKIRKAAKRVWAEVEVYRSWLQIDLQKMASKRKTSKEILKWLGDEAEKIMREFKSSKNPSIDQSPYQFILASSMYRISRSMLLQCDEKKCHHHAIEKREDNIRNAAKLLGKSKKILKILKARKLPNMDRDSRANIDKWHVLLKSQMIDGGHIPYGGASSTRNDPGSSSCDQSLIVSIM